MRMLTLTETGTKNLLLHVRELADLYALKTLYDYLAKTRADGNLDVRVFFGGSIDSERSREVLQNAPTRDQFQNSSIDAVVSCYSDIGGGGDLEIDISVLKNAVAPMSKEEKAELKQRYGVKSKEPVLVIGYASPSPDVVKVVEAASKHATVYLVGYGKKDDYHLSPEAKDKVHVVDKHGVLKDYYAMADVAINANNLRHSSAPLHNFVEATEGGRLFMIPFSNLAQYGYRQLVNAGVIAECTDLGDLVDRVQDTLRNFDGNERVIEARARHLTRTRDAYLPVILAKIMQLAGEETALPDSDLDITQTGKRVRIMHPDSNWGLVFSYMKDVDMPQIKTFKDSSYFSKFKGTQKFDYITMDRLGSLIIKKKYSLINESNIENLCKIIPMNNFEKISLKKNKPIADDDPFGDSFMLGDHSPDNPLKKPKRQTGLPFNFKEIPSDLLAKYASLLGNPRLNKIMDNITSCFCQ